ncbi:hypothetical protein PCASD_02489 [Puccinia coronata f. sp. avenae]|uniref:Uncharacterized protein n=1 Tax=Puccinia coronata f. sp. avenae TaxID=200324 RepID=A0A2N5VM69_9BASI|nr:hypothetical protein PCASD_02489 [Puccinia coronata f. sp. avenae]
MVMSSDKLLALWENLHQLSLNNYWNTEERNLLSQVGERLKKSIESSDSEDEGPPKQSTSTTQPAIIPRPSPTNPQQSSNSVNNTPASKSHCILAGGSRVSEDTLYRQVNYPESTPPPPRKNAQGHFSTLTAEGDQFLESLLPHLTQKGRARSPSPIRQRRDETPFNREAWLAEKRIRQQEQMTYNYRHSSYHNNMPANWSNYAELSDRDAEGETDNEDAMDLDPEVGSSHPKKEPEGSQPLATRFDPVTVPKATNTDLFRGTQLLSPVVAKRLNSAPPDKRPNKSMTPTISYHISRIITFLIPLITPPPDKPQKEMSHIWRNLELTLQMCKRANILNVYNANSDPLITKDMLNESQVEDFQKDPQHAKVPSWLVLCQQSSLQQRLPTVASATQ